jgi:hypothetical protein
MSPASPSADGDVAMTPEEPQAAEEENLCVICLVANIEVKLVPCGHAYFCEACAAQVIGGAVNEAVAECPLCREPIEGHEPATQEEVIDSSHDRTLILQMARLSRQADQNAVQERAASWATHSTNRSLQWFFPWWQMGSQPSEIGHVYHAKTRLKNGMVGLMPDTGAHANLMGSVWAREQSDSAAKHGLTARQEPLASPKFVQGVGQGHQRCDYRVDLPCALVDIDGQAFVDTFSSPCVEGSGLPGLLGAESLRRNRALIDNHSGRIAFVGPGGYQVTYSPGTRVFQMVESDSGHWLLPINSFEALNEQKGSSNDPPLCLNTFENVGPTTTGQKGAALSSIAEHIDTENPTE